MLSGTIWGEGKRENGRVLPIDTSRCFLRKSFMLSGTIWGYGKRGKGGGACLANGYVTYMGYGVGCDLSLHEALVFVGMYSHMQWIWQESHLKVVCLFVSSNVSLEL